jgi:hypothetical protein
MSCAGYRPRPLNATALSRCAAYACGICTQAGRGATSDSEEPYPLPDRDV